MNLIYDVAEPDFSQEINEATGSKKYVIKGIFSSPGKKNRNGRVYPINIWEREVANYQDILKNGHPNSLMELNHPPRTQVDMMEAVAKVRKLWIENGYVMGEAVLLDNPKANQLKTLIDNGIKMAVSTRGVGKIGSNGIVEDYKLITTDIIPNLEQSDHQAEMFGITEGVLKDKNFEVNESGDIVEICSKDKCLKENRENINKAILDTFDKLFEIATYEFSIDLSVLPVRKRNEIMTYIKRSGKYYKLEDQVVSFNYKLAEHMFKHFEEEKENRAG